MAIWSCQTCLRDGVTTGDDWWPTRNSFTEVHAGMRIVFSLEELRKAELAKHSHLNPVIISIISMENAPFNWQSEVNAFEERWQPHSRSLQLAVLPRKVNSPPTRWRQRPESEQEKKHNETHSNASWIRRFCVPWFYVLRMFYVLFGWVSEETSLVRVEGRILGNVVRWAGTTWRILHSC